MEISDEETRPVAAEVRKQLNALGLYHFSNAEVWEIAKLKIQRKRKLLKKGVRSEKD